MGGLGIAIRRRDALQGFRDREGAFVASEFVGDVAERRSDAPQRREEQNQRKQRQGGHGQDNVFYDHDRANAAAGNQAFRKHQPMLANIEYIPTASPVVVHNGTQFVMELDPPRRFVGYAWAFLEDVYRMRTVDMSGDNRLWHTARMLGACATNLRNACEAHFGRGNLHLAPDPNVMWFITGARHLSAHASKMPGVPLNAMKLNVHINNVTDIGWMEADTSLSIDIDLSDDLKVTKHRDDARRFLHAYQGKLYLALHAATRKVAEWVQMPLDPDFEKMGNQDYGRILLRIPLKTAAARQRVLSAISNGGDMEVPLDELERKGWDINGHWMPENGSTKTEPSNAAHQPGPG